MSKPKPTTLDLFSSASDQQLEAVWPSADRFPLNQDYARVDDIVLADLCSWSEPLIVTGFATLDRHIDFVASVQQCDQIRATQDEVFTRVICGAVFWPTRGFSERVTY